MNDKKDNCFGDIKFYNISIYMWIIRKCVNLKPLRFSCTLDD